ncbi:unnamed protein product [Macrosiphum euphorbiae]|uniref:Uncharacterized protein n=1 Tax=Macrosiphum euphorbiae TaxID=13131 RepID=A0AAV0W9M1_9HEMI|nr:unnamed protein product [Macrosiphum euphorbiae]
MVQRSGVKRPIHGTIYRQTRPHGQIDTCMGWLAVVSSCLAVGARGASTRQPPTCQQTCWCVYGLSMPTLNRAFAHTIVVEVTGS